MALEHWTTPTPNFELKTGNGGGYGFGAAVAANASSVAPYSRRTDIPPLLDARMEADFFSDYTTAGDDGMVALCLRVNTGVTLNWVNGYHFQVYQASATVLTTRILKEGNNIISSVNFQPSADATWKKLRADCVTVGSEVSLALSVDRGSGFELVMSAIDPTPLTGDGCAISALKDGVLDNVQISSLA